MTLDTIWVYAEGDSDAITSTTQELLTKARDLADTVAVVYAGDGDDIAEAAGAYGAETVYATGDLEGALVGVPVAAAIAAAIESGDGPDAILLGTHLRRS